MQQRDDWFVTVSGRRVFVLSPDPELIIIEDIAHALSNICRFSGHTREFYSVAQHSSIVSRLVPREVAFVGLMHDCTEAYLGDVIRPVKRQLERYTALEHVWWRAIAKRFGLPLDIPQEVHVADVAALLAEKRDLVASHHHPWLEDREGIKPAAERIVPMSPKEARAEFLARFEEVRR